MGWLDEPLLSIPLIPTMHLVDTDVYLYIYYTVYTLFIIAILLLMHLLLLSTIHCGVYCVCTSAIMIYLKILTRDLCTSCVCTQCFKNRSLVMLETKAKNIKVVVVCLSIDLRAVLIPGFSADSRRVPLLINPVVFAIPFARPAVRAVVEYSNMKIVFES